jgi:hypothetical protein
MLRRLVLYMIGCSMMIRDTNVVLTTSDEMKFFSGHISGLNKTLRTILRYEKKGVDRRVMNNTQYQSLDVESVKS